MKKQKKEQPLHTKALRALREAARDLVKERALHDDYVVVWKDNKVQKIPAKSLLA